MPIKRFDPNYLYYHILKLYVANKHRRDITTANKQYPDGQKQVIKILNGGGTRSAKSYDIIHVILTFLSEFNKGENKRNLYVAVYRDTLVRARDTTLKDFLECFGKIGLKEGKDYTAIGLTTGRPVIRMWGHTIEFKGMPEDGQQGGRADIVYINELLENRDKDTVMKIIQRCELLFLADWNPSLTEHWAYHLEKDFNTFYTHTTYLDNKHLSEGLAANYESKCPWDFKDSVIQIENPDEHGNGFKRRIWLKPERPEVCPEKDYHLYRAENQANKEKGTIDRQWWLQYGEGIAAAQEGAIFREVKWIDSFPETGMEQVNFGLDFGYSGDPSALIRCGVSGKDAYIEKMAYQRTPTVDILMDLIKPHVFREIERRKREAQGEMIAPIVIACDSSDKYKDVQFVRDLNVLSTQMGLGWQFVKVQKPNIVPRISLVKRFKLNLVEDPDFRTEQQNYVFIKNTDGTPSNIPDADSKFNHIWDAVGYCFWYFYKWYLK